jgi:hypothetical protein
MSTAAEEALVNAHRGELMQLAASFPCAIVTTDGATPANAEILRLLLQVHALECDYDPKPLLEALEALLERGGFVVGMDAGEGLHFGRLEVSVPTPATMEA